MKKYLPRLFYNKLGVQGLASLTNEKKTKGYIRFLKKALGNRKKILDCACGYGRLAIPLALDGYQVRGIDISEEMVLEARIQAQKSGLGITIDLGDMRNMPYPNLSFDAVICMWSSFNELLNAESQVEALREMVRVTVPNGIIIIDVPYVIIKPQWFPKSMTSRQIEAVLHKQSTSINNLEHIFFVQTVATLQNRLYRAGIDSYTIKPVTIGGAKRLIITITSE